MTNDIKRKIASDALKQGVITVDEYDLLLKRCFDMECLNRITNKMADDFYGRMVNNQATINLKDYGND